MNFNLSFKHFLSFSITIFLTSLLFANPTLGDTTKTQSDWLNELPASQGLDTTKLAAMDKAIKAGTFQQITSVLMGGGGNLVYEFYYDAEGMKGLRNTRSATKTVTGMLAGAAIERGHIASIS